MMSVPRPTPSGRVPRGFVPAVVMNLQLALALVLLVLAVLIPLVFDGKARARDRERFTTALTALVAPQTAYHARHGRFAASLGALGREATLRTPRILRADSAGWTATLESDHVFRPRVTCGVFDGPASYAPDSVVTRPREVACWGVWLWVKRTRE